jgi:hypothetical protein
MVVNIGNEKGDLIMTEPTVTPAKQKGQAMTEIERKALALMNEVYSERGFPAYNYGRKDSIMFEGVGG